MYLLQQQTGTSAISGFVPMSPRLSSPSHPGSGGQSPARSGGRGRGRGGVQRDTKLLGQTVRIIQGHYKGYIGIVKDATETTARVELNTDCKTISVDKTRLAIVRYANTTCCETSLIELMVPHLFIFLAYPCMVFVLFFSDSRRPGMSSRYDRTPSMTGATPMYGAGNRTPMYGSQTPQYEGARTPHYGSMTPSHEPGSMTPGRASAWDPSSANTPR